MLFSDSLPQLWLTYVALSLVVLITGYLAVRPLPLLPRLLLVGLVAGSLWMIAPFSLPMLEPGEAYGGLAPAIVVIAVGVLQHDMGQIGGALPLLLVGAAIGAGLGFLAWRAFRGRGEDSDSGSGDAAAKQPARRREDPARAPSARRGTRASPGGRREPSI